MPSDSDALPVDAQQPEVRLERLTRDELKEHAATDDVVIVPVGAIEQHGPHLSVDTDLFLVNRFAIDCARAAAGVLVAPPIAWGLSGSHVKLGSTLTLNPTTLLDLGLDIADSLMRCGFRNQLWLNGHFSNSAALGMLVYECRSRYGVAVAATNYYDFSADAFSRVREGEGPDIHAAEYETSLMLFLSPDRVRAVPSNEQRVSPLTAWDGIANIGYTFADRFPSGVAGLAHLGSAEKGAEIYDETVRNLGAFIDQYRGYKRDLPEQLPRFG